MSRTRFACRSRCAKCVRDRIVRAFLIEEQKQVKLVLQEKEKQEKKETKPAKKCAQGPRAAGSDG